MTVNLPHTSLPIATQRAGLICFLFLLLAGCNHEPRQHSNLHEFADLSDRVAQYELGLVYANAIEVDLDYAKAAFYYKKSAEQGYARAQYNLGLMYSEGKGVEPDAAQAFALFERAAVQGLAAAQFTMGVIFKEGYGRSKDIEEAIKWTLMAAQQGYLDAQYNLAVWYGSGDGVEIEIRHFGCEIRKNTRF